MALFRSIDPKSCHNTLTILETMIGIRFIPIIPPIRVQRLINSLKTWARSFEELKPYDSRLWKSWTICNSYSEDQLMSRTENFKPSV